VHGVSQIPFWFVQAAGRPDLVAKVHLIEFPLYLTSGFVIIKHFGIEGAAVLWVFRMIAVTLVLFLLTYRLLPESGVVIQRILAGGLFGLLILFGATAPMSPIQKVAYAVVAILTLAIASWRFLISNDEREMLSRSLRAVHSLAFDSSD
jgi:O-antigen/teichoic acid export membrane protein